MRQAEKFARDYVQQGAEELHEWSQTSILRDGVVRQLSRHLKQLDSGNSLSLAQTVFTSAIIAHMAGVKL